MRYNRSNLAVRAFCSVYYYYYLGRNSIYSSAFKTENNFLFRHLSTGRFNRKSLSSTLVERIKSESLSSSMMDERIKTELDATTGWLHFKDEDLTRNEIGKRNHRMTSFPMFHPCGSSTKRAVVTEHVISVPLNRAKMNAALNNEEKYIEVFFRIVELINCSSEDELFYEKLSNVRDPKERARVYVKHINLLNANKCMLYLQGGPGFGSPEPIVSIALNEKSSWLGNVLFTKGVEKVILLDQRGTGKSTPITKQTLELNFRNLFVKDSQEELQEDTEENFQCALKEATEYLQFFRADNIVLDAEDVKDALLMPLTPPQKRPWGSVLGQSYGGFCILTYLSQTNILPPQKCFFTGGIAPLFYDSLENLYYKLFQIVKQRNLLYYEKYPQDVKLVKCIVKSLMRHPIKLPSGGYLTPRRFLQIGIGLGSTPVTSFAKLHSLLSSSILRKKQEDGKLSLIFSRNFLKLIDSQLPFDDHPIYFLLHESIYANGNSAPTNWAAYRALTHLCQEDEKEWDYTITSDDNHDKPVLFYGEMIFPWMPQDFAELSGHGISSLANAIASKSDWPKLYDFQQIKLALNPTTPNYSKAAAAVYVDDMYVHFDECCKVTQTDAPLEKCKVYITNQYQHSGLRDDGANIIDKLWAMIHNAISIPS